VGVVPFVTEGLTERTQAYLLIRAAFGTVLSMYKHEISIARLNSAIPHVKPLTSFELWSDDCLPSLGVLIKAGFEFLHFLTRHLWTTPNGLN
jgi:hypothetical protein